MKFAIAFLFLFGLFSLVGCYTVPTTGRSTFHLFPEQQLIESSKSSFAALLKESTISYDPQQNSQLQRVGRRIARAVSSDLPQAEWEFVVLEDDEQINAFAMPGGKVGVYTGMMNLIENDDELAIVVGHEIAHVTARHGNERLSRDLALGLVGTGLNIELNNSQERDQKLILAVYGAIATGTSLKWSRGQESEADYIGLIYAAKAGYNPEAALSFWEKMRQKSKGRAPVEFLSTHPHHETRVNDLQSILPEAKMIYQKR